METLRCMIVVEYVGRYYYRLYSVRDPKAPDPSMLTANGSSLTAGGQQILAENYGQEFNTNAIRIDI